MTEQDFYMLLRRRLSQTSIGPSTVRNQGAPGIVAILRTYFEHNVNLNEFINALPDHQNYQTFINQHTNQIVLQFPENAQSWGAARKGLNIFLREIVYSKFFSNLYTIPEEFDEFNNFVQHMEVPLDKDVAKGIRQDAIIHLPNFGTIKHLTYNLSSIYQNQATIIANNENIARINLDLKYWRAE